MTHHHHTPLVSHGHHHHGGHHHHHHDHIISIPPPIYQPINGSSSTSTNLKNSKSDPPCTCFFSAGQTLLIASITIAVSILVVVLVDLIRYYPPALQDPPQFHVSTFNITKFDLNPTMLSSRFVLELTAQNPDPNRNYQILYGHKNASVFYGAHRDTPVAESALQVKPNAQVFVGDLVAYEKEIDGGLGEEILSDVRSGVLRFDVRGETEIKVNQWFRYKLMVDCTDVKVRYFGIGAGGDGGDGEEKVIGSMIGPLKLCQVQAFGIKDRYA